jgi:NAD(P)-dependent dehydrogenase (short-subunit alcohol dehydrogenase family)
VDLTHGVEDFFNISGKVAVVTGAASGLGASIAEAMVENHAPVALFDVNEDGLEDTAHRLRKSGAEIVTMKVDVSGRSVMRRAIDRVVDHFGCLDITFGNAGIGGGAGFLGLDGSANGGGEIGSVTDEHWDKVLAVNLSSVFATIQTFRTKKKERWAYSHHDLPKRPGSRSVRNVS